MSKKIKYTLEIFENGMWQWVEMGNSKSYLKEQAKLYENKGFKTRIKGAV